MNVAMFNGGLFDPNRHRHPFLENYDVGDQYLQQAIDKLAVSMGNLLIIAIWQSGI